MVIIKTANPALRFLLELCALAALAYWGWRSGAGWLMKSTLVVGAPLVAAVVWAIFISPNASVPVPLVVWLLLQAVIFGLAMAALTVTGYRTLAFALGMAVVLNGGLMYVWGQ